MEIAEGGPSSAAPGGLGAWGFIELRAVFCEVRGESALAVVGSPDGDPAEAVLLGHVANEVDWEPAVNEDVEVDTVSTRMEFCYSDAAPFTFCKAQLEVF